MQNRTAGERTAPAAKRYQAMKNRLFLLGLGANAVALSVFIFSGWSVRLRQVLSGLGVDFFVLNTLYFFFFGLAVFFLSLPLDFYEGFVWEKRFGLSSQTPRSWLVDFLKKTLLAAFVSFVFLHAVYFLLRSFPLYWWLPAAFFWFFVSVVLARLAPKILLPLFFKVTVLDQGPLRDRINAFLGRLGVRLKDVYVLDFSRKTKKANAMVAGLGSTKRIYLSDTLVEGFDADEIEAVVAHEVGHYLHRDAWRLAAMSFLWALFSFFAVARIVSFIFPRLGLLGVWDIAGLPVLLLALLGLGLFLLPLQNGFSRHLEVRADIFCLEATKNVEAFTRMMRRLGSENLAEFSPSPIVEFFLYDHPPLSKRIGLAHQWQESRIL